MSKTKGESRMGTEMMQAPPAHYSSYPPPQQSDSPFVVQGGRVQGPVGDTTMPIPVSSQETRKESTHRFVGFGVGIASICAEHVLSHPCIVLRRQCQVNVSSSTSHLTPFTLVPIVFNIQTNQSVTTLWKGIVSHFMVKGIATASDSLVSECTPLPKEVTRHSSLKKIAQHILLKGIGIIVMTPFYASSLVETVQSEIASEPSGVLDCLREGCARLLWWTHPQTTTLLPIWKLVVPVLAHGLMHYIITSLAQYTVTVSASNEVMEREKGQGEIPGRSLYEAFYPELLAAFTGNLLADTMLYPLETIIHRLFLQGTRTIIDNTDTGLGVTPSITRYQGFLDCLRSILSEEGLSGLYKGFGALILQYGIHMSILKLASFLLEYTSREMERPLRRNEGAHALGGVGTGQHRGQPSLRQVAASNQAAQSMYQVPYGHSQELPTASYRQVPMSESYKLSRQTVRNYSDFQ